MIKCSCKKPRNYKHQKLFVSEAGARLRRLRAAFDVIKASTSISCSPAKERRGVVTAGWGIVARDQKRRSQVPSSWSEFVKKVSILFCLLGKSAALELSKARTKQNKKEKKKKRNASWGGVRIQL